MRPNVSWQTDDRNSRHVRHARLRAGADAPLRRLASYMEEGLRLASLPGEDQGRAYYFQHVRVAGLAPDGDRRSWLDKFQRAFEEQAVSAVHGSDARAGAAPAVFFRSRQEALEILLRRVVERRPPAEWFWPMVAGGSGSSGPAFGFAGAPPFAMRSVPGIVEALRSTPAEWAAVAAALFAAARMDAVRLLDAIPEAVAQAWLQEMDPVGPVPPPAKAAIAGPVRRAAAEALRGFGPESPRALWYTAMAVLHDSPAEMAAGTLLARSRVVLWDLLPHRPSAHTAEEPIVPAEDLGALSLQSGAGAVPAGPSAPEADPRQPAEPGDAARASEALRSASQPWLLEGAPTQAAGLFFLLNVLERIGVPEALASGLAAASPDFVPRLLLCLARHSGVAPEDPVVEWLISLLDGDGKEAAFGGRDLRRWAVAVRRWCWRIGKMPVREIVARHGMFTVNRTDLDISLPFDEADVRIRRVGLDLDPGWLPWFGRVVRFHYSWRRRSDV